MSIKTSVFHVPDIPYAYPVGSDRLNVRLKIGRGVKQVIVHYKNLYDHTDNISSQPMELLLTDRNYALFETTIQVKERHFKYYFEIHWRKQKLCYTSDGWQKNPVPQNYFYYPVINESDILQMPKGWEGETIYQIWVDRFFDGNPANNPENVKPPYGKPDRSTYYGGDFAGIIAKLPYLVSLGVSAIYLSPVFKSPSYHKYDISDYDTIETIYGGEKGLMELVDKAHEAGIKVVLDAVFNHCSILHPYFQEVVKNGESSRYAKWFCIESFPVDPEKGNYDTFASLVPEMPKWNTSNPEVIAYLTDICVNWTKKLQIDGWRFDVADEVSTHLWGFLRKTIKRDFPDVLMIGEIWNQAGRWMQGDQMDTVTNYKYRFWLLEFLTGKIGSEDFWNHLNTYKMLYPTPMSNYLVNLIGSHDTIRSVTFLKNRSDHFLTLGFLLLSEGIPLIYYGDEIGLEGNVDPDNRRAFDWSKINSEDNSLIRALGCLRKNSAILKKGKTIPLKTKGKVLAFKRIYQNQMLTVVVNYTEQSFYLKGQGKLLFGNGFATKKSLVTLPKSIAIFS
jgi:cyclomaltodextrinase